MQFRTQGNRIQVLAYRGYNKEKRRAEVKLVGSFNRTDFTPSDGLIDALTDDEKTELQSHIDSLRQSHDRTVRQANVEYISRSLKIVSDSLTDPECARLINEDSAAKIYAAMDELAKGLRKLGFKRVAKTGAKVAETDPGGSQ